MVAAVTSNVVTTPGTGDASAAAADGTRDNGFAQLLGSFGSSEAAPQAASAVGAALLTTTQAGEQTDRSATEQGAVDQSTVAAELLALFGLPTAPPTAIPVTPVIAANGSGQAADPAVATIAASNIRSVPTASSKAAPLSSAASSAVNADDGSDSSIAVATSTTAPAAAIPAAADNTLSLDRQWLQSMTDALRASATSGDTPKVASTKLATTAALEVTHADSGIASQQSSAAVPGQNSLQMTLDAAANNIVVAVPLRDLRRSESGSDSALTTTTGDPAPSNAAATLQPAGTMLASDASKLDQQAGVKLHAAVGSHQWVAELGNKLTMMAGKDTQSATLYMTPADLGPVQVRIDMNQSQASVWFTAEHPDTRSALEQSLPRLREMFTAQGMSLTDAGVFGNRSGQQQAQSSPGNNHFTQPLWSATDSLPDTSAIRSISLSMLDAYA